MILLVCKKLEKNNMKRNKIDEISFMGSLIGWLAVNQKDNPSNW